MHENKPDIDKKDKRPVRKDDRTAEMEADREVARRLLDGDREALKQWLDRYMAHIYGYVLRRIGPGGEVLAGEVTNATFESAARKLKAYARGAVSTPMRLWLLKIAGDQLARRRGKSGHATISEPEGNPRLAQMQAAIRNLAPRKQHALSLALIEGLSGDELAGALGVRLPRAMSLLRAALHDVGKYLSAQSFLMDEGE